MSRNTTYRHTYNVLLSSLSPSLDLPEPVKLFNIQNTTRGLVNVILLYLSSRGGRIKVENDEGRSGECEALSGTGSRD